MTANVPGPTEILPTRPDAIVDLQTLEGAALVGGQWRYSDTTVRQTSFVAVGPDLGPSGPANRTYEVVPHAQAADFDDTAAPHQGRLRSHHRAGTSHLDGSQRDPADPGLSGHA